jgi:hypothetical protein
VAIALLTVIVAVVMSGDPAASATRKRDRGQTSPRPHGRTAAADGMPARFVAEIAGRIAIVSADTGRVEDHLTADSPTGGAGEPSVSPDGRTVWFSRTDGPCAAHLASVPVAGGHEEKVAGSGEAGPERLPLPRPGRAQLAYSRSDCKDSNEALVVGDLRGLEGYGQMGLVPLAWSRDGDQLLATSADGRQVHLLEVNKVGAIVADQELTPPDRTPECRLEVVGFSPDDNKGYVAVRRCGPTGEDTRRSLVLLDKNGGFRQAVLRLPRGQDFIDRIAFDPSGHSLLYATAPTEVGDSAGTADGRVTLWLWRDGESRVLARQSRYRHPSWLP